MRIFWVFIGLFFSTILPALSLAQGTDTLCLTAKAGLDRVCARVVKGDANCKKKNTSLLAWSNKSCLINASGQGIIQEIADLKDGDPIPQGLFQKHSTSDIARTLVYRHFQKVERPKFSAQDVEKPHYSFYHDAYPMMAISDYNLSLIIKNGFLNQHQVGHSKGVLNQSLRLSVERKLSGLNLESSVDANSPENFLLPKYAFGAFAQPGANINPSFASHYGNVFVVFPEEIKKRAFMSNGDSLNHLHSRSDTDWKLTTYYNLISTLDYQREPNAGYYESQIWGKLPFSTARFILVGCFDDGSAKDNVIGLLKNYNLDLPVYSCEQETQGTFVRYVPKNLLYGKQANGITVPKLKTPSVIKIVEATFGSNIDGIKPGNVTDKAASFCNGKTLCSYKVSAKFIGDPAPNQDKSFDISWTCTSETGSTTQKKHIPADATDKSFDLTCPTT